MKQLREMHEEMIAQQERLSSSLQTTIKSQNKEIQSLLTQSENKSEQIRYIKKISNWLILVNLCINK
jgi:gas vesicle protein